MFSVLTTGALTIISHLLENEYCQKGSIKNIFDKLHAYPRSSYYLWRKWNSISGLNSNNLATGSMP